MHNSRIIKIFTSTTRAAATVLLNGQNTLWVIPSISMVVSNSLWAFLTKYNLCKSASKVMEKFITSFKPFQQVQMLGHKRLERTWRLKMLKLGRKILIKKMKLKRKILMKMQKLERHHSWSGRQAEWVRLVLQSELNASVGAQIAVQTFPQTKELFCCGF